MHWHAGGRGLPGYFTRNSCWGEHRQRLERQPALCSGGRTGGLGYGRGALVYRLFAPRPISSYLDELSGRRRDCVYFDIDVRGLLVPAAMRIVNAGMVTVGGVSSKAAAPISSPALRSLHGRPDRSGSTRSTDLQSLSLSLVPTSPMMRRMHFITAIRLLGEHECVTEA